MPISALLPTLTNIVNLSLVFGTFPDQFKSCSVIPLLKKYNLDEEDLANYRPISYLSFLSKFTKRFVKNRLTTHLCTNNLLNSYQSAYNEHHFTESIIIIIIRNVNAALIVFKKTAGPLSRNSCYLYFKNQ